MYLNKLTLIGFTGGDAETKSGNNGIDLHRILDRHEVLVEERRRRTSGTAALPPANSANSRRA